ncbi:hypothetical protein B0H14DRAFT_1695342 [Mycena olivaceomarginata]|nr:hypothetical protein B0H14DRAFT_1695342 [Mycena olivaceomarginata]
MHTRSQSFGTRECWNACQIPARCPQAAEQSFPRFALRLSQSLFLHLTSTALHTKIHTVHSPCLVVDTGPLMPLQPSESHTVNIYGGTGGNGGDGGAQGGGGGAGEGPTIHYEVIAGHYTVNNFGNQHSDSVERKEIIEWLSPINFFLRHADISQARQHGTGGWLLADPHFQEWEAGSGRTLWCHGIPGAGKTVLASMVCRSPYCRIPEQKYWCSLCLLESRRSRRSNTSEVAIESLETIGLW